MVTTVPLIDVINGQDYTFTAQAGGDWNGFARGAWDWSMLWKRIPLDKREMKRRKYTTSPYRFQYSISYLLFNLLNLCFLNITKFFKRQNYNDFGKY